MPIESNRINSISDIQELDFIPSGSLNDSTLIEGDWIGGEQITASKLNHIDESILNVTDGLKFLANKIKTESTVVIPDDIITNCFSTVQEMCASTTLEVNTRAYTLGFYSEGDGGGGVYNIYENTSARPLQDNGSYILQIGESNLYAVLIGSNNIQPVIHVEQYGIRTGNTAEENSRILELLLKPNTTFIFQQGKYLFNKTINITNNLKHITFQGIAASTILHFDLPTQSQSPSENTPIETDDESEYCYIEADNVEVYDGLPVTISVTDYKLLESIQPDNIEYIWQMAQPGSNSFSESSLDTDHNDTFQFVITEARAERKYRCVMNVYYNNQQLSIISNIIEFNYLDITDSALTINLAEETTDNFILEAVAIPPSNTYQWQYSITANKWIDIENATSDTLVLLKTQENYIKKYRCIASYNNSGDEAALVVSDAYILPYADTEESQEYPSFIVLGGVNVFFKADSIIFEGPSSKTLQLANGIEIVNKNTCDYFFNACYFRYFNHAIHHNNASFVSWNGKFTECTFRYNYIHYYAYNGTSSFTIFNNCVFENGKKYELYLFGGYFCFSNCLLQGNAPTTGKIVYLPEYKPGNSSSNSSHVSFQHCYFETTKGNITDETSYGYNNMRYGPIYAIYAPADTTKVQIDSNTKICTGLMLHLSDSPVESETIAKNKLITTNLNNLNNYNQDIKIGMCIAKNMTTACAAKLILPTVNIYSTDIQDVPAHTITSSPNLPDLSSLSFENSLNMFGTPALYTKKNTYSVGKGASGAVTGIFYSDIYKNENLMGHYYCIEVVINNLEDYFKCISAKQQFPILTCYFMGETLVDNQIKETVIGNKIQYGLTSYLKPSALHSNIFSPEIINNYFTSTIVEATGTNKAFKNYTKKSELPMTPCPAENKMYFIIPVLQDNIIGLKVITYYTMQVTSHSTYYYFDEQTPIIQVSGVFII